MAKARDVGVNSVVLFPKVPDALKVFVCVVGPPLCILFKWSFRFDVIGICFQTPTGDEAYNDNGLVPRTIRLLKDKFPDIVSKPN